MALTKARPLIISDNLNYDGAFITPVVKAGATIYEGAGCEFDGFAVLPMVGGSNKRFAGFAMETKAARPGEFGVDVWLRVAGVARLTLAGPANRGDKIYASDDSTFTRVSTGNTFIGVAIFHHGGNEWGVRFDCYARDLQP